MSNVIEPSEPSVEEWLKYRHNSARRLYLRHLWRKYLASVPCPITDEEERFMKREIAHNGYKNFDE